ncbi:MAG: DUF4331 domain-containing protein [Acidimicrobiia bacterium]|nr:DUF4331 domain-containing protein [Acidimicrobiia bacterium]
MTSQEFRRFSKMAIALVAVATICLPAAWSADHLEAPFVSLDGRIDINDLYVFPAADPDKRVLVLTVNPAAGVISGTDFRQGATYQIQLDTDDDNRFELTYRTTFGRVRSDGRQRVKLDRIVPGEPRTRLITGFTGEEIQEDEIRFIAGTFDDPFFFDLDAFRGTDGRAFCDGNETDFFAGLNVSAIVLELPESEIGASFYRVQARTTLKGLQADRMGFPAISTVFIPSNPFEPGEPNVKDAYNATAPIGDRTVWSEEIKDTLALFHTDTATIDSIADFLLPDLLPVDPAAPPEFGFPNGRRLADDVIDAELELITAGFVSSDCVDANDVPFSSDFPYLAPAN